MTPLEQAHAILPCYCISVYTDWGLINPDCPRCNFADKVAEAIAAAEAAATLAERERCAAKARRLIESAEHHTDPTNSYLAGYVVAARNILAVIEEGKP